MRNRKRWHLIAMGCLAAAMLARNVYAEDWPAYKKDAARTGVPLHLKMEISRFDYEPLIEPLLSKTLVCVDEALSDAKLTAKQIDRVILVGGASRTPLVHHLLQDQLGQPIHAEVDPDLCVSMGAAIQGGLIAGLDLGPVLVDITPHTLGVQCIGSVDGLFSPYRFAPIIERNTALPASRSEVFGTSCDNQEVVAIDVFQGEDQDVRHNEPVGGFRLEGLADAKRGNEILVRFDLDLDGILKVTATEKATGLEERLTIDNAMSRFRSDNRESAKARLEAAFAGAEIPTPGSSQPPPTEPDDDLRPEPKRTITEAEELLHRANRLLPDANEQDAEEMQELMDQLRAAIQARTPGDIQDAAAKLDDLVFYLQDAP